MMFHMYGKNLIVSLLTLLWLRHFVCSLFKIIGVDNLPFFSLVNSSSQFLVTGLRSRTFILHLFSEEISDAPVGDYCY